MKVDYLNWPPNQRLEELQNKIFNENTGQSVTTQEIVDCYSLYKYKTISVDHLKKLQDDIDKLKRGGNLSDHETYRSYINELNFTIPENLPDAKSVIVIAIFTKLMKVNFHLNGKKHETMLPPGYYLVDGFAEEDLRDVILKKIIKKPGYEIERSTKVHLKLLAVRSGLGRYGRNNICYVNGMGSFLRFYAYFTDFQFEEDNWNEIRMMKKCEHCKICMNNCPNNCIRDENFVIDVGKCVTLYNEIEGDFPEWISHDAHNALVGCMKCQLPCPANHEVIKMTGRLEGVTEEETEKILEGISDEKTLDSLCKKLKMAKTPAGLKEIFPVLRRNLKVLIW